jgi:hypothetical protein
MTPTGNMVLVGVPPGSSDMVAQIQQASSHGMGIVWTGDMLPSAPGAVTQDLSIAQSMGVKIFLSTITAYNQPAAVQFVQAYGANPAVVGDYWSFEHPLSPDKPGNLGTLDNAYSALHAAMPNGQLVAAIDWMSPTSSVRQTMLRSVPGTPAVAFFAFPFDSSYGTVSNIMFSAQDLAAVGHGGIMLVQGPSLVSRPGFNNNGSAPTESEIANEVLLARTGGINTVWYDSGFDPTAAQWGVIAAAG